MAEQVQFQLERMLPELEAFERKEIYTPIEIKAIIKKRTNFEYALHRRIKKKIDFLRCIEYEMNLEKLRKKRVERLGCTFEANEKNVEYSGIKRIYGLFKRATKKFTGDIALWLQYIDFAKKNDSSNVLSGIFVEAIQYHPMNASIWVMAASWEYEHNHNIAAARSLMQRAIRLLPENKLLWHEYFRLELIYVEKITIRREILGIKSNEEEKDDTDMVIEEKNNVLTLPQLTGEDYDEWRAEEDKKKFKMTKEAAESFEASKNPILQGLLAKIVYNNAIEAIPNDIEFRKGFITIYGEFSHMKEQVEYVYETIQRDMNHIPEARALLAERHLLNNKDTDAPVMHSDFFSHLRKCVDEYHVALQELGGCEIYEYFIQFILNWYSMTSEENIKLYFTKLAQKTFKTCKDNDLLSRNLFEKWVQFAIQINDFGKAKSVIDNGLKMYPNSVSLWLNRIQLSNNPSKVYVKALAINSESLLLWSSYKEYVLSQWDNKQLELEEISSLFANACDRATMLLPSVTSESSDRNEIKALLQSSYVEWAAKAGGIDLARKVYLQISRNNYPTYEFIMKSLEIENQYGDKETSTKHVENLLEKLVVSQPLKKSESYMTYLSYLYSQNQHKKATEVYNRACKEVENREAFDIQVKELIATRSHDSL